MTRRRPLAPLDDRAKLIVLAFVWHRPLALLEAKDDNNRTATTHGKSVKVIATNISIHDEYIIGHNGSDAMKKFV